VAKSNQFIWFEKWVIGKQTLEQLVFLTGHSKSTIQRLFKGYLKEPPKLSVTPLSV
jgi:hypothetical protein